MSIYDLPPRTESAPRTESDNHKKPIVAHNSDGILNKLNAFFAAIARFFCCCCSSDDEKNPILDGQRVSILQPSSTPPGSSRSMVNPLLGDLSSSRSKQKEGQNDPHKKTKAKKQEASITTTNDKASKTQPKITPSIPDPLITMVQTESEKSMQDKINHIYKILDDHGISRSELTIEPVTHMNASDKEASINRYSCTLKFSNSLRRKPSALKGLEKYFDFSGTPRLIREVPIRADSRNHASERHPQPSLIRQPGQSHACFPSVSSASAAQKPIGIASKSRTHIPSSFETMCHAENEGIMHETHDEINAILKKHDISTNAVKVEPVTDLNDQRRKQEPSNEKFSFSLTLLRPESGESSAFESALKELEKYFDKSGEQRVLHLSPNKQVRARSPKHAPKGHPQPSPIRQPKPSHACFPSVSSASAAQIPISIASKSRTHIPSSFETMCHAENEGIMHETHNEINAILKKHDISTNAVKVEPATHLNDQRRKQEPSNEKFRTPDLRGQHESCFQQIIL